MFKKSRVQAVNVEEYWPLSSHVAGVEAVVETKFHNTQCPAVGRCLSLAHFCLERLSPMNSRCASVICPTGVSDATMGDILVCSGAPG